MTEQLKKRAFTAGEADQPTRITRSKTIVEPDMAETTQESEKEMQEFVESALSFAANETAVVTMDQTKADQIYRRLAKQTLPYTGNGSLRLKALQTVLTSMQLDHDSVLLDMGCGPGNVLMHAIYSFQIKAAIGIEIDLPTLEIGRGFLAKNCSDEGKRIGMFHGDLALWSVLPKQITHVFAYDRVMPPIVLINMARLLNDLRPRILVSFVKPAVWMEHGLAFTNFTVLPGCNTTGGQVFTGYKFAF